MDDQLLPHPRRAVNRNQERIPVRVGREMRQHAPHDFGRGGDVHGGLDVRHQSTSALLPFFSSQLLRSAARFLPSSMSSILPVLSPALISSCTSRRVFGSMVVSRNCSGFISPRPLKRVTVGLARGLSLPMRSRVCFFSSSSSA